MRDVEKRWFVPSRGTAGSFYLYCFAHAGAGVSAYAGWQHAMPDDVTAVSVQLPGRGSRFGEAPLRNLSELTTILTPLLARHAAGVRFAFFGHSFGALLAFEVARTLSRRNLPRPARLFVSGCHAPRFRDASNDYHLLDDKRLVEVLRQYGGSPPEVLADQELISLLLPTMRADLHMAETYRYAEGALLDMPITALAGRADEHRSIDQVTGWGLETAAAFDHHWFDGGHLFVLDQRRAVLARVAAALAADGLAGSTHRAVIRR